MARSVVVAARIPREGERNAVLAWARQIVGGECTVEGEVLHLKYTETPANPCASSTYWAIVQYFEQYHDATITVTQAIT